MTPRVHVVGVGGTIAGLSDDRIKLDGYSAGVVGLDQLLEDVPEVDSVAEVTSEQFCNEPSSRLTAEMTRALALRVAQLAASPEVDAVVLTHGTATLEETAYLLHLTCRTRKPIVLVGSMRPWSALSGDGPINLFNAVRVAADPASAGLGALVVMNDEIHSAREVTKYDTQRVHAFVSPGAGYLGISDPDGVYLYRASLRRHTHRSEFTTALERELPRVDVFYGHQDFRRDTVDAALEAGARGIVCAFPTPEMKAAAADAVEQGIAVVYSDRKGRGRVLKSPELHAAGIVTGDDLRPQKARILLQLALAQGLTSVDALQRCFDEY